jgi:hypothetical protein
VSGVGRPGEVCVQHGVDEKLPGQLHVGRRAELRGGDSGEVAPGAVTGHDDLAAALPCGPADRGERVLNRSGERVLGSEPVIHA